MASADNRTTELLCNLLEERGIEWKGGDAAYEIEWSTPDGRHCSAMYWRPAFTVLISGCTPEQAIAATLGKQKAKAHPYGYEPDTGAFDMTRCECGCLNDISAIYCNDCGGEIEIDMNAEKEIYHTPRHSVFVTKHDDGSLELCERRYVPEDTVALGGAECRNLTGEADWFECSECGTEVSVEWCGSGYDVPNFCPKCGRKVK